MSGRKLVTSNRVPKLGGKKLSVKVLNPNSTAIPVNREKNNKKSIKIARKTY